MSYEEFQHLARLFVVGALDEDEREQFCAGRDAFGLRAEQFITECRKLNSIFALSLCPRDPSPGAKEKLLAYIRTTPRPNRKDKLAAGSHLRFAAAAAASFALESRIAGRN